MSVIPSGGVGRANTASAWADFALRIKSAKSLAPGAYSALTTTRYPAALPASVHAAAISRPQSVFSWKIATVFGRSAGGRALSMGGSASLMSGDFQNGENR